MHPRRLEKVNSLIQRTLAKKISELSDGEGGLIGISRVETAADLKEAKIFFTSIDGDGEDSQIISTQLGKIKAKLQKTVAKLGLKYTAKITFIRDANSQNVVSLNNILAEMKNGQN